jgi:hypothetical protein
MQHLSLIKRFWWVIKCSLGLGTIKDGSICWFSCKYWDVHDYKKNKGGDGKTSHFYEYQCASCSKRFTI